MKVMYDLYIEKAITKVDRLSQTVRSTDCMPTTLGSVGFNIFLHTMCILSGALAHT